MLMSKPNEKETPKKPTLRTFHKKEKHRWYVCPKCGNACLQKYANSRQLNNYCWDCGQKLDWSDK